VLLLRSPRSRLALLAGLLALAPLPHGADALAKPDDVAVAPAWPAPPAAARVRWLASVASDRGEGAKRSWLERLRDVVTGDRGRRLQRPVAVCAADDGSMLVSDPATSTVYEMRRGENALRVFADRRLATPTGLARLPGGDVWVSDADRGVLVRFDARGRWRAEVGGGALVRPTGLAYDRARDRLYVADAQGHRIVVFDGEGRRVGAFGARGEGPGQFNFPTDVKVAANGDLLVCDALNFRIQRLAPDGRFVSRFGEAGDAHGRFARPKGVALDAAGHVYVTDALHDVVQVFDDSGRLLLIVGERGAGPGRFNLPAGVAIGPSHRLFVADAANHRVQVFELLADGGSR